MSGYDYDEQLKYVLTENGQAKLLETWDRAQKLCKASDVATMEKLMPLGDTWFGIAIVERLVELGRLTEVAQDELTMAQYRIFRLGSRYGGWGS